MFWNPIGVRTKGWPRWRDEVINDLKNLKLRNCSQVFKDRKAWDVVVQKIEKPIWGCGGGGRGGGGGGGVKEEEVPLVKLCFVLFT